jgi:hypothetical protein
MTMTHEPAPVELTGSTARIRGLVDQIDDGVARVFVGDHDDEWFFPSRLFPAGTVAGDCIWLERVNGSYSIVGATRDRSNPDIRGFAERLNRLRTDRRGLWNLQPVVPTPSD